MLLGLAATATALTGLVAPASPPPGWTQIGAGVAGGTVWQGVIPGGPRAGRRISAVYLPPHATRDGRYPLLVVLHGFPGDPWSIVFGLRFADAADAAIAGRRAAPFVAVMPAAALHGGEWVGPWERWLVRRVLPWADRRLPVRTGGRAIAGLSAGGYGAVDVGLRHPRLFAALESWSGYFRPLRDGPLRHATAAELRAHDPAGLLAAEAPLLRRLGTRVFLSVGAGDPAARREALAFDGELRALGVAHTLRVYPGGHDGRLWRRQLPAALAFAFAA